MAFAEYQNVVELPKWYRWLGTRFVTDPYSKLEIDLLSLECENERLTQMTSGDRLCCDFVAHDVNVPVTSFYDEAKRIWIHIRRGGTCQTGGATTELHD